MYYIIYIILNIIYMLIYIYYIYKLICRYSPFKYKPSLAMAFSDPTGPMARPCAPGSPPLKAPGRCNPWASGG